MDANKIYRDAEKHLRENECQPLIKKQPLPLPRRYINNRTNITHNGTNQQNYLKSKSDSGCRSDPQLIIDPPRRFSNEYEKELELKFPSRKKTGKDTLKSISYYPILSPPPGFQDDIKLMENCENINPVKMNNCDCSYTERSKTGSFNTRNIGYYRDKGYNSAYFATNDKDKMPFSKSHYRRRMTSDYPEYEFNNRLKSESFNEKGGFSSWRSESDPYSECSQYSYKCYCNHCRVGSVPSTLSHSIASDASYQDVFDEREHFDVPSSVKSYNLYELETPRRQKVRRAASFQARCANTYYPTEENSIDYYYGTQPRNTSKIPIRNRYASFDGEYHLFNEFSLFLATL